MLSIQHIRLTNPMYVRYYISTSSYVPIVLGLSITPTLLSSYYSSICFFVNFDEFIGRIFLIVYFSNFRKQFVSFSMGDCGINDIFYSFHCFKSSYIINIRTFYRVSNRSKEFFLQKFCLYRGLAQYIPLYMFSLSESYHHPAVSCLPHINVPHLSVVLPYL